MKKIWFFLIILGFGVGLHAQSKKERRVQKKAKLQSDYIATKSLIESGDFQFTADLAIPLGNEVVSIGQSLPGSAAVFQGNQINLFSNPNFLRITKNKTDISLPFFGRVFFPRRINNQTGIEYKGDIKDYSIDFNNKKKLINIKYNCDTTDDNLQIHLRVNADGNTRLVINSTNRQTISYQGNISKLDVEK